MACNIDTLSYTGSCLPGTYTLSYAVANADGEVASATRQVVIYQSGRISASFELAGSMALAAANQLVADLRVPSSDGYKATVQTIKSRLGPAGQSLLDSDLEITSAAAAETAPASGAARVTVSAIAYVYYPANVHRGNLSAAKAAGVAWRRRQLLGDDFEPDSGRAAAPRGAGEDLAAKPRAVLYHVDAFLDALHRLHGTNSGGGAAAARHARRRRLLQISDPLATSLATFGSAFDSSFGAGTSSSSTNGAAVDVVAGYLAAMASSVALLEERAAALNTRVQTVAAEVEQAFGAEAQQRDAARDSQVETLYQVSRSQGASPAFTAACMPAGQACQGGSQWGPAVPGQRLQRSCDD